MRPLRNSDPSIYRNISIRTDEARLWVLPSKKNRKLIGGIIARYQEIFHIEIYAYCFLGNHYHLLIRALKRNTDEFLENVNREIARRMNWKNRRKGKFWGRRYDDIPVLSQDDLLEAFVYINTNPTKHGLLRNAGQWPGLTSFHQSLSEEAKTFSFTQYGHPTGQKTTNHQLKLSVLPMFEALSKEQRTEKISELFEKRMARIAEERQAQGEGFMTLEMLAEQVAGTQPKESSTTKRPSCYTKCAELRRQFREKAKHLRQLYTQASFLFRLGKLDQLFPSFTYKPPLHRRSRKIPFTPLPDDYLLPTPA